ncbi:MAG TPA: hypothetical protein VMR16_00680 [Candidatus Saccharimonadales bacterium]|nr:hypothetical protein [Candidatus Saccharimonadales bacterium]
MQPEAAPQQYSSIPTEPTPTPKRGFNWKRLFYFITVAIVAAALSGLAVWGYMSNQNNSNSKSLNAQITTKSNKITSLQSNVKSLQTQVAAKTTSTASTSQPADTSTDVYKSLITFCSNGGYTTGQITLTNQDNDSSYFANCAVSKGVAGGSQITARYVDNVWQQIYNGQGAAAPSVCTQYSIPNLLGACSNITISSN